MDLMNTDKLLFEEISAMIERTKRTIYTQANRGSVLLFWNIGRRVNDNILQNKRADYGKQIVVSLSRQLSWSHILALIPLKTIDAKMYYANESLNNYLGVRDLRKMISRKAYERKEIADTQITPASPIPTGSFKDPYLFDVLGIKDEYLEEDVETAIINELEKFILEFGKGFTFAERQKRMIIDGEDHHRDYSDIGIVLIYFCSTVT